MRRRDRGAERHVPDLRVAGPVQHGYPGRSRSPGGVLGDAPDDRVGVGVRLVVDGDDGPAFVVVADLPAERDDCARGGGAHQFGEAADVDGLAADARQDDGRIPAVRFAAILNPEGRGLVRREGERVVGVVELFDDVGQSRADGADGVAHASDRPRRVQDEGPRAPVLDDPRQPPGERRAGHARIVSQEVLDPRYPPGDEGSGRLRGEVAARDAGAAGSDDHPGAVLDRRQDRALDAVDAVGDDGRPGDGSEFAEQVGCQGPRQVLARALRAAVRDGDDGYGQRHGRQSSPVCRFSPGCIRAARRPETTRIPVRAGASHAGRTPAPNGARTPVPPSHQPPQPRGRPMSGWQPL